MIRGAAQGLAGELERLLPGIEIDLAVNALSIAMVPPA